MPAFHASNRPSAAGLLHSATITAAGTVTSSAVTGLAGAKFAAVYTGFNYGSGGTVTAQFYVQTSIDGTNWMDVACMAFGTVTANKVSIHQAAGGTALITPTDGSLSDDTAIDGVLGDQWRVKQVTTGTYGGSTTVTVGLVTKG